MLLTDVLISPLRRLLIIFPFRKSIRQIEEVRQTIFVRFFGLIGVSAFFSLYVSLKFLKTIIVDGV